MSINPISIQPFQIHYKPGQDKELLEEAKKQEQEYRRNWYAVKYNFSDRQKFHLESVIAKFVVAKDAGSVEASYHLGRLILKVQGMPPPVIYDADVAVKALEFAFQNGVKEAGHLLADLYLSGGAGLPIDKSKAIEILIACDEPSADTRLFYLYKELGENSKAIDVLKKSAENGNLEAKIQLGYCYARGELGLDIDNQAAKKWLESCIDLEKSVYNKLESDGLWMIGRDTLFDVYQKLNDNAGVEKLSEGRWFSAKAKIYKANQTLSNDPSQLDEVYSTYKSMSGRTINHWTLEERGIFYRDFGRILYRKQKAEDMIKAWKNGASIGNSDCKYYLGLAYFTGDITKKDRAEAAKWWNEAAKEGNALAIQALNDETNSDGEKVPFTAVVESNTNTKGWQELKLDDTENKDLVISKKNWFNRTIAWIRKNPGKIAEVAFTIIFVAGIIAGLTALTIFFPAVMIPIWTLAGVGVVGIVALGCFFMAQGIAHRNSRGYHPKPIIL